MKLNHFNKVESKNHFSPSSIDDKTTAEKDDGRSFSSSGWKVEATDLSPWLYNPKATVNTQVLEDWNKEPNYFLLLHGAE